MYRLIALWKAICEASTLVMISTYITSLAQVPTYCSIATKNSDAGSAAAAAMTPSLPNAWMIAQTTRQ